MTPQTNFDYFCIILEKTTNIRKKTNNLILKRQPLTNFEH